MVYDIRCINFFFIVDLSNMDIIYFVPNGTLILAAKNVL